VNETHPKRRSAVRVDDDGITRKRCTACGEWKPLDVDHFYRRKTKSGYSETSWESWCRSCRLARRTAWGIQNQQWIAEYGRSSRAEQRMKVLRHYGGESPACACCGESELAFLAVDHIDGGGNQHAKEIGGAGSNLIRWLIDHDYPDGFQILCHNCNVAKSILGACPHQPTVVSAPEPPEYPDWCPHSGTKVTDPAAATAARTTCECGRRVGVSMSGILRRHPASSVT
jgi:hypothetical protein